MVGLWMVLAGSARAETADEIVDRARAANQVSSSIEGLRMTLVPKTGSERVMELEVKSRRDSDGTKTYLKVLSPSDVAGTQLLQLDHASAADEQMMYLPAFKRVNLISGSARKGQFLGSDFSFEDLDLRDSFSGTRTLVSDGADAWVIDTALTGATYTKVRATIVKSDLVLKKLEFYTGETLVKVLEVKRTEKDGAVTLPVETEMTDVKRGSKTRLEITSHRLNVAESELPADTFTKAYLERGG